MRDGQETRVVLRTDCQCRRSPSNEYSDDNERLALEQVIAYFNELRQLALGAPAGTVLNDFAGHQTRVNHVLRLDRGQSIGSGLPEGSIKQLLNKRMKQTGARWRVEHVAPLVELGALAAGPEWDAFWKQN